MEKLRRYFFCRFFIPFRLHIDQRIKEQLIGWRMDVLDYVLETVKVKISSVDILLYNDIERRLVRQEETIALLQAEIRKLNARIERDRDSTARRKRK